MLATDDRNKNTRTTPSVVQLFNDFWRHWNGRKGINEAEEEEDIWFRQEETQSGGFHLSCTLTQTGPRRRGGRGTHWIKEQGMRSGWEDEVFLRIFCCWAFSTVHIKPLKSDAFIFLDRGQFFCIVNKRIIQSRCATSNLTTSVRCSRTSVDDIPRPQQPFREEPTSERQRKERTATWFHIITADVKERPSL